MGYRYIGSKARIANDIIQYLGVPQTEDGYFIDAFSGTGIVASKAADAGWKIKINDMMHNAAVISEARLLSAGDVPFSALGGYEVVLETLRQTEQEGFIWKEYSPASLQQVGIERKYFTEDNARRIDGAVEKIHLYRNWHPAIKAPIIKGLTAQRNANTTAMGYVDVESGRHYTNGSI